MHSKNSFRYESVIPRLSPPINQRPQYCMLMFATSLFVDNQWSGGTLVETLKRTFRHRLALNLQLYFGMDILSRNCRLRAAAY